MFGQNFAFSLSVFAYLTPWGAINEELHANMYCRNDKSYSESMPCLQSQSFVIFALLRLTWRHWRNATKVTSIVPDRHFSGRGREAEMCCSLLIGFRMTGTGARARE
ncbi:uncharacterized protein F5891DRAFT_1030280 [Suillus fuscotomentosus]|uniref:Secreted protein n=1 Tax=Suillus fuscotomentosus TaxID=1912939 RepID=A0AAD4HKM9_9AGAM|nr:uncharacterized protein F5891DRAFT_1030280 [Suillus fuscotomentosus]KAG1901170.1 hypothetical protein F5891DRAFT_1030280 [Suillus fuscotomentosus]